MLLERLSALGVCGRALSWFTNYLSHRLQHVELKDKVSSWSPVKGGIPQGSALGPLLFLVYVNTMPSVVRHCRLLQFADDTAVICSGANYDVVRDHLNSDMERLHAWITGSRMRLNAQKSSIMWFSSKRAADVSCLPISINGSPLHHVETQKYLGIIFDNKLQWGAQLNNVCKQISYYLYMLGLHRRSLTFDVLKMLSESLIFSRINYVLPVWGPPLNGSQVGRLQRLQNRAIRITKCLKKYDHVSQHRQQLKWLPISHQIKFRSACAMYRYYHQPCMIFDPPIVFGARHCYNSRCKDSFANLLTCRLTTTKRYFRSSASSWWNSLIATVPVDCTYTSFGIIS